MMVFLKDYDLKIGDVVQCFFENELGSYTFMVTSHINSDGSFECVMFDSAWESMDHHQYGAIYTYSIDYRGYSEIKILERDHANISK